MSHDAVTQQEDWALFLDVDGTLLEVAETPDRVHVPEGLKSLLKALSARLGGALALVSGRAIADLDTLFSPLRLCASGVHGAERRDASGTITRPPVSSERVSEVREELARFVALHQGLLLEDKTFALAVHFRLAPEMGAAVHTLVQSIVERLGAEYVVQAGKCVYEIRPGAWTKGTAIRAFLQQAPFRGRTPIYVGDDVTDEDAFAVVNSLDGLSVRVGEVATTQAKFKTQAKFRLDRVADVHRWLDEIPPPAALLRAV